MEAVPLLLLLPSSHMQRVIINGRAKRFVVMMSEGLWETCTEKERETI